jgi:hypothetical protein
VEEVVVVVQVEKVVVVELLLIIHGTNGDNGKIGATHVDVTSTMIAKIVNQHGARQDTRTRRQ